LTRDSQLPEEPEEEEAPEPHGDLRTTGPGLLAVMFLVGLVGGRLVEPISIELDDTAPRVGWLAVLAPFFVAVILAYVAWSTYRTIHRRHERLEPHQAVNRLVLAKACAIVGALLAGGYFGYAISWVGEDAPLAQERLGHSLLAGAAGVLIVTSSLALERACRVRSGQD
jgi:hypothetical protein